jgi:hypothetical protein
MKIKNLILGIISVVLVATIGVQTALAVSATLTGEITDDGGDPNLTVWFQYGKTSSYGYETSHQSKTGTGEFTANVSSLDVCTTYHYRAAAKHQNFNDTMYGEDKTFTTQCNVTVDLKANNSDGPVTVAYKDRNSFNLSWTSQNADSCTASGDWSGSKSTSGSETIQLSQVKTYTFTLTCKNNTSGNSSSDSVQVTLQAPNAPQVVTKGVVVTYFRISDNRNNIGFGFQCFR